MSCTENNTGTIIIVDNTGNIHKVLAVKPCSSNPEDSHLLRVMHTHTSKLTPWVVHTLDVSTGGFSDGDYCRNLNLALQVFNHR